MPQSMRAKVHWKNFNMPVSYRTNVKDRMKDARNVYSDQDVLETRYGISRYNSTALGNDPTSVTFFKQNDGTRHIVAKDGTSLVSVQASGAHTSISTGLTDGQKHRAITLNGRHILAMGTDGLKAWDGSTFTQLGQAAPTNTPSVAASGSGNSLPASDYRVRCTFYASAYGFETNAGPESATVTVSSGQQIDVTNLDSSASNGFIDKKRVYVKDVTADGPYYFWEEINLATTTSTVDDEITSTIEPPETHATPPSEAQFIVLFGNKIAVSGNTNSPGSVYLSQPYLPDAFDDAINVDILQVAGGGGCTGLAVGTYQDSYEAPYLVLFTESSIEVYTEINGVAQQSILDDTQGCTAPDTIKTIGGDVYFMSNTKGWSKIENGVIEKNRKTGKPVTLANRDIDDIFTKSGYIYELNKSNFQNFFSVYYPTLEHYLTFVSEGGDTNIRKAYNFEFQIDGFRPYEWSSLYFTCAALGKDSNSEDVVYLGGQGGYIYTHSVNETRADIDIDNNSVNIDVFTYLYWWSGEDLDASYNFGSFILKGLAQDNEITAKYFEGYSTDNNQEQGIELSGSGTGFILDVSKLDEGILGDGRDIVQYQGEILRTSKAILIGLFLNANDVSIGLLEGQLDISKNGNPN